MRNKLIDILKEAVDTLQSPTAKSPEKTGELPKSYELTWIETDKDGKHVQKEKTFASREKYTEFKSDLEFKPNFLQIITSTTPSEIDAMDTPKEGGDSGYMKVKLPKTNEHLLRQNYRRFFKE